MDLDYACCPQIKTDSLVFIVFDIIQYRPEMRQNICISLKKDVIDPISSKRVNVPRNRVLESLIAKGMEFETITSCPQKITGMKEGDAGARQLPVSDALRRKRDG
jgi:hypothetical protein